MINYELHTEAMGIKISVSSCLLDVECCYFKEETLKNQQCPVENALLDGHLSLTVELLAFRTVTERYNIGSHPNGQQLIKVTCAIHVHSVCRRLSFCRN